MTIVFLHCSNLCTKLERIQSLHRLENVPGFCPWTRFLREFQYKNCCRKLLKCNIHDFAHFSIIFQLSQTLITYIIGLVLGILVELYWNAVSEAVRQPLVGCRPRTLHSSNSPVHGRLLSSIPCTNFSFPLYTPGRIISPFPLCTPGRIISPYY